MENIAKLFEEDFLIKCNRSINEINLLEKNFNYTFPIDYSYFLMEYDGGEGLTACEENFLTLYGFNNLREINFDLHNIHNYPSVFKDYIFIGKNAGPTYYDFNKYNNFVYEIPELISDEIEIQYFSDTFLEFLSKYARL
jgi:hypothetical protein